MSQTVLIYDPSLIHMRTARHNSNATSVERIRQFALGAFGSTLK
jgi:hypothetical protein